MLFLMKNIRLIVYFNLIFMKGKVFDWIIFSLRVLFSVFSSAKKHHDEDMPKY